MPSVTPEQAAEFTRLADEWDKGIRHYSLWRTMTRHPNYEKLVAYGKDAAPLVLCRLKRGDFGIHWSMLLYELSGERCDYQPDQESGFYKVDVTKLAKAWIKHFEQPKV